MTHLHIPDGLLSYQIWVSAYAAVFLLFVLFGAGVKKMPLSVRRKKVVHSGVIASLMIIAMSLDIAGYHPTLAVLSGIVLGVPFGFYVSFVSNLFLALLGHGAVTTIGLNTLVLFAQMLFGIFLFKALGNVSFLNMYKKSFATTFIALILSSFLVIALSIVGGESWGIHAEGFTIVSIILGVIGSLCESAFIATAIVYIYGIRPALIIKEK